MEPKKEAILKIPKKVFLVGDIGGTNTRLALCTVKGKKINFHVKYYFTNNAIKSLKQAVNFVKKDSKSKIIKAVFAVAGPVSSDRKESKLTNIKWRIKTKDFPFKTLLLNDLEAAGYSINVLGNKDIKIIKKGESRRGIGLISVGTGLGKSYLIFDKFFKPYSSEGGHALIPVFDKKLLKYMKKNKLNEFEDFISGRGLINLYRFYSKTKKKITPAQIMASKTKTAQTAKKMFSKLLGRCSKNFALDLLSDIYIGGGVIAKNPNLIDKTFKQEFLKSKKMKKILEKTTIKIILNEDLGLLGAAFAAGNV